jgi:hypothetical protein
MSISFLVSHYIKRIRACHWRFSLFFNFHRVVPYVLNLIGFSKKNINFEDYPNLLIHPIEPFILIKGIQTYGVASIIF